MIPPRWPVTSGAAAPGPAGAPAGVPAPSRGWRTAVAVSVATAIGAIGHVVAGGTVSIAALAVALGAATVPAWLSSRRECSWTRIAALQAGNQQLAHLALSFAAQAEADEPAMALVPHDLMLLAHIVAALITAVALRAVERRLWAPVRRIAARLGRWWRWLTESTIGSPVAVGSTARVSPDDGRPPQQRMLRHAVVLRGPPLVAS